jgi:hypothetical protein
MNSFRDNCISSDAFGKPKKSAAEMSPGGGALPSFSDSDEDNVVYATDHAAGYNNVDEAATEFTDSHALYKRGKRVGKLTKLLGNQQNVTKIQRFKTHIIGTVILLFVAHICCFVAMVMLIRSITINVHDLHDSAFASRKVFEMAIDTQAINIILQNYTYPELMNGFTSTQDLISWVDGLDYVSKNFKTLHQGVYLGFTTYKRLPTKLGLADLWEKPSLNITMFYDTEPEMTHEYIPMGLWDAGNLLLDKSRIVWTKASEAIIGDVPDYGAEDTRVVDISLVSIKDTAAYHFVMTNAPNIINKEYLHTLDLLTQLTITSSETVNTVHLIIIALDGLVLVAIAALYTYYLTTQVVNMRYNVYSCFLLIPKGIVKAQAERKENLEDAEEDDDDNVEGGEEAPDQIPKLGDLKAQPLSSGAPVAINMNRENVPGDSELASSDVGFFRTMFDLCFCCFRSNKVYAGKENSSSKRKLIKSRWNSFNLVWPFIIWSAVVVIMNSINYVTMVPLGVSLGLLNTVYFNLLRHDFFFFFSMEYAAFNSGVEATAYHHADYLDPSLTMTPNARFRYEVKTFEDEYMAMLYGGAAVPTGTGIHWEMIKTGVATSKNNARAILYGHGMCLCEDQSSCQEEASPLYDVTRSGLDSLIREYFIQGHNLFDSVPSEAQLNSTAYNFIITLGQADVEGGLVTVRKGVKAICLSRVQG